jgi:hypothetical protein
MFTGRVVRIAPKLPASGTVTNYRLAKYEVLKVAEGIYKSPFIVVDQIVMRGDELQSLSPGDTVCVIVRRKPDLSPRFYAHGIRSKNERVDWFYVATSDPKLGGCGSHMNE